MKQQQHKATATKQQQHQAATTPNYGNNAK